MLSTSPPPCNVATSIRDVRVSSAFDAGDFDGIISIPILRDLLATVDLGGSWLRLERGGLPAPNGGDALPIVGKDRGGRIDVEMSLGGVTVPVVLDSRSFLAVVVPDSLEPRLRLTDSPRVVGNARGPSPGMENGATPERLLCRSPEESGNCER